MICINQWVLVAIGLVLVITCIGGGYAMGCDEMYNKYEEDIQDLQLKIVNLRSDKRKLLWNLKKEKERFWIDVSGKDDDKLQ